MNFIFSSLFTGIIPSTLSLGRFHEKIEFQEGILKMGACKKHLSTYEGKQSPAEGQGDEAPRNFAFFTV